MTPERWHQATEIFHAARQRRAGEREAFLTDACHGDASLRRDVESLLSGDDHAGAFGETPVSASPALEPGSLLGPYRVECLIGSGGMGEVYRAHDWRLGRDVAIKVLPADLAANLESRERLLREARAAASLSHPHICTVYDVGEVGGRVFVAMEIIDGRPLSARIAAGPFASSDAIRCGVQLAGALAYAHSRGVVHRDLKSANVMLTSSGDVKIVDFGLAKHIAAADTLTPAIPTQVRLTQSGAIMGTPAYMSPEQLQGTAADARSDVWALGVMLYELAAGAPPFTGQTEFSLAAAIISAAPPPLPPRVPAALQTVVRRCLEKEPARRYQHGGEVRAALEMAQVVAAEADAGRPRIWLIAWAGVAVTALALSAALVRLSTSTAPKPASTAATAPPAIRLAVVPFENLTGDPQQDYFSDGLTEEMIAQLGKLAPQRLRVIARTSTMRYKRTTAPVDQIGRELGVDYILGGSARRDGPRVRVTAQLVQVSDQTQLWSDTYDRDRADILALQNDIAQRVARGLALQLLPTSQRKASPIDPDAYDLYLQGLARFNSGPPSFDQAQQCFEAALRRNPRDALSYAGLASVWQWRGIVQMVRGKDAAARQKAAAVNAVALDDTLAESHAALAGAYVSEMDWARADTEFKRALQLNPNHAGAHSNYGLLLSATGRSPEATTHFDWASALDPLNSLNALGRSFSLLAAGRVDDAVREARLAATAAPGVYQFHMVQWRGLHIAGNDRGALTELVTLYTVAGHSDKAKVLEKGFAEGGYREAMRQAAEFEETLAKTTPGLDPATIALFHHDAGNLDRAFVWMEQALEDGDPNLPAMGTMAPDLKNDPRFRNLLQRMGLPN